MDRCIFCGEQVRLDTSGVLFDGSGEHRLDYICADTGYGDGLHRTEHEVPC